MFPEKTICLIIFVTNAAWYCGTIPIRFEKRGSNSRHFSIASVRCMVITPTLTKRRSLLVQTTFSINLFYLVFIMLRLMYKLHVSNWSQEFVIHMSYQLFAFTMIVVLQLNTLYMWEEIPRFFVRYLAYFRYLKDRYGLPGAVGPKCFKFFYAWLIVGVLVNVQNTLLILKIPSRPHYLTAMLDNPEKALMIVKLPFMLMQFTVWITSWSQVWAMCFHLYAYFCALVWTIRELDVGVKLPKTSDSLRHSRYFLKELRSIRVLHRLWQHAHQGWFCPSNKFVAVCVTTLGSYGVIRLGGPLSYTMGCMAAITMLYMWTLYSKFGQLHDISRDMLWNWRHHPHCTKWMRKYVKSVPVLCVNVASFYYVTRRTVFTVFYTVLNNTVTLLLI